MFKSDALIESKSLRESVIDRTEVLDKVKALAMLPDDLHVSVEMAANYFEMHVDAIESTIRKNRDELTADGMRVLQGQELSAYKAETGITSKTGAFTIIPRRAILRIGMLLRDSIVALRVRDYLLDVEEIARVEAPEVIKKAVSPAWRQIKSNVKAKRDLYLLVGVSKESAIAHALTHEELETGVDLTAFKREVRTDDTEKTFTPTDLGKLLENPMSAMKVNIALEKAGLQVKSLKGEWELTDKGKTYARLMPVAVHGGGVTVERYAIRWRQNVLELLRAEAMLLNAKTRQAKVLRDLTREFEMSPDAVKLLVGGAIEILVASQDKTYTAAEIARELGVKTDVVDQIAKANGLTKRDYSVMTIRRSHSYIESPFYSYNEKGKSRLLELMREVVKH